jgi:hypothetical protein
VTRQRAGRSGLQIPAEAGRSLFQDVQTGSGAHSDSYSVGTGGVFPMVKRPGREVYHSPSSGAGVGNEWSHTSSPTTRLHGAERYYFTSLCPNLEKWGVTCSEVLILGEICVLSLIYIYVAVCRFCVVRCVIVICLYLLFRDYSTEVI